MTVRFAGVTLAGWTKQYQQEPDDSTADVQEIIIVQEDFGPGPYWIIKSAHWAINNLDELIELLEKAGVERRNAAGG